MQGQIKISEWFTKFLIYEVHKHISCMYIFGQEKKERELGGISKGRDQRMFTLCS